MARWGGCSKRKGKDSQSQPRGAQAATGMSAVWGRHWEVRCTELWALYPPRKGRECPSVRRQGMPLSVLGREQARTALTLCGWGDVLHKPGVLLQPPPEQRPKPGFAAADPEFWDAGTLPEADSQPLTHPLNLLQRKERGVCEPSKPDSPCLMPVGSQLEGAGLSKSAEGWHLQHHLKNHVFHTSSESSGRGFPTSRGKEAHPHMLWRGQL